MKSWDTKASNLDVRSILSPGLIVSCQARPGTPLLSPEIMAAFALSAQRAGAVGIRANSPRHVAEMKDRGVTIPIIGIDKQHYDGYQVYITPTRREAEALAKAGADVIAIDGTRRPRPHGETLEGEIAYIQGALGIPVMLDISNLEEALYGEELGPALIATTLAGYTPYTKSSKTDKTEGPELELLKQVVARVCCPVLGEGRFHTPEQVRQALATGAYGVVVGTALTDLEWCVRQFIPEES
jgi:N-acylglucosamine-6-phosphate 2-epimerase